MAAPRVTQAEAAAELLRRRAVRRSLTEFAIEQGFTPAAHHKLLIAELEALVEPESNARSVVGNDAAR